MVWIKQLKVVGVLMVLAGIVTACSISYKFNGSSIDYRNVKTIYRKTVNGLFCTFWGTSRDL